MMTRLAHRLGPLTRVTSVLAIVAFAPSHVLACPTCYASAGERVITSYLQSAALLTLLPFTLIGIGAGITLYLRRQARLSGPSQLADASVLGPTA